MGLLNLEGKDIAGFVIANLLGFLAGRLVPTGLWSIYVSILVSYHLFLLWLVLTEQEGGVSLPIASTIVTHLACLALILPLGLGRHVIPFFGVFRFGIAGLAIFERGWLFSGNNNKPKEEDVQSVTQIVSASGDDYQDWLRYLAQQKSGSRKVGTSLKTEYEEWLLARARERSVGPSND
jgi:hypothetical protein